MTLFTDPLVCVSNNGFLSEFFAPTRTCRQGCTFSPIIFTATIELLGLAIRQDPKIEGIKVGENVIKTGQFADNLWTASPPSQDSLNTLLALMERFKHFAGLRINPEKTAILRIGPFKDSEAIFTH